MLAAEKNNREEIERLSLFEIGYAPVGNVWGNANPFGLRRATAPLVAAINSLSPQVGQTITTTNQVSRITRSTFSSIPAPPTPPHSEFLKEEIDVRQYGFELLGETQILFSPGSGRSHSFLKLLIDESVAELEQTPFSSASTGQATTETIALDAEEYARSTGIFGSLVVAKGIVKETLRKLLGAIHIDRMADPEDPRHITLCLQLSVSGNVDEIYELDKTVQRNLMQQIPNEDFPFIGVLYQFE